jgi:hypothetical protein
MFVAEVANSVLRFRTITYLITSIASLRELVMFPLQNENSYMIVKIISYIRLKKNERVHL